MGMRPSPCHEKLGLFQSTEQPKHSKLKPGWSSRLWGSWELGMRHIIDPLHCAHPCLVSGGGGRTPPKICSELLVIEFRGLGGLEIGISPSLRLTRSVGRGTSLHLICVKWIPPPLF